MSNSGNATQSTTADVEAFKAQLCQRHYSNSLQQMHSQKSAPQKYNTRERLNEKTTPPTISDTAAPHTPPKVQPHMLEKYTLEEITGTEKAHTGREYTWSHAQHSTYQSRHMTGHTSRDSGDKPNYK